MLEALVVPFDYEHDRITTNDLQLLGLVDVIRVVERTSDDEDSPQHAEHQPLRVPAELTPEGPSIDTLAPGSAAQEDSGPEIDTLVEPESDCFWLLDDGLATALEYVRSEAEVPKPCAPPAREGTTPTAVGPESLDTPADNFPQPFAPFLNEVDGDLAPWKESEAPLEFLWETEVPEPEDHDGTEIAISVSSAERARQLALAFLQAEDICSARHLDLLSDIIVERGWSSVQTQVRGLIGNGYSVGQVHRMFQLTSTWLHFVGTCTVVPHGWRTDPRLTWRQAARLLDFLGYDTEPEQVIDFLAVEQEVWSRVRRRSGHLACFRDYLFEYRLSTRTQVEAGVWQLNLDPSDERSFDGTRNHLYSSDWWDEPTDGDEHEMPRLITSGYDLTAITEKLGLDSGDFF